VTVDTSAHRDASSPSLGYSPDPLTTFAIDRPHGASNGGRGIQLLKYADLALIAIALPIFVIADLPLLGWLGATIGWCGQRGIQYAIETKASQTEDVKGFFRLMAGSLIGRSWFLVISIFTVGLIQREAGLAAALLSVIVFTFYLAITLVTRPTKSQVEGS
jgi:vacuolar-type H+-ATPase subunit I/STV1